MTVDIIDIGIGNIQSIKNWIGTANVFARSVSTVKDLESDLLILPGVGEAGSFMKQLKKRDFDKAIKQHVHSGGRLIGICLGFQILSSFSDENGGVQGLGLINAKTKQLVDNISHTGWEKLSLQKDKMFNQSFHTTENISRKTVLNGRVFYNHEYGVINEDKAAFTLPVSSHFKNYSGLFVKEKIIGIQFHPEKSQLTGKNLISMII